MVDLEPKAMKLYEQIEDESYADLKSAEVTVLNVLTKILRLSQITGGHLTDDDKSCHIVSTAKLDALSDIIDTMQNENRKLAVIARFTAELDDIETLLQKRKSVMPLFVAVSKIATNRYRLFKPMMIAECFSDRYRQPVWD